MTPRLTRAGLVLGIAALLLASIAGCAAPQSQTPEGTPSSPVSETPDASASPGAASGTGLALGVYEQPDGTVMALGILDYRDLEGGMWVLVGGSEATGDAGTVIAVIANPEQFAADLEPNKGGRVEVLGTVKDGVSTRMAGPEIEATKITAAPDAGGPAQ